MASTAAVLNIMVAANTAPASGQLLALQKQLAATTAQANTTSTTVGGGLSKGGKMAAVGLGAAAVAAIGVGKALSASVGAARSFESSFAEVRKTVDTNEAGFRRIERGLRNLAKQIPVPVEELNNLAGEAGALGIAAKDIVTFTRVAAQLGTTTNLSSEEASNALARLANIMGTNSSKFENLASTLVGLGNAGASTESEIAAMALRIASTGKQVGLTEADVLGFASALASVGIEAEAGGSAISRAFSLISESVATGNDKLSGFAKVAQMSVPEFSKLFERDAAKGMLAFIKGLGEIKENGGNALVELQKLGINEIRLRNALLSAAGAGDLFNRQLRQASFEFSNNRALAEEAEKRYATFDSQVQILKGNINDLAISLGQALLPGLKTIVTFMNSAAGPVTTFFQRFAEGFEITKDTLGLIPVLGPALKGLQSIFNSGDDTRPNLMQRISEGVPQAIQAVGEFTQRLQNLRAKDVKATNAAKQAEQRLNEARRKHGPNSREAILAEAQYRKALDRSRVAKRKLMDVEKLSGPVKRATKNLLREEVGNLKAQIQKSKNAIQVDGARLELAKKARAPQSRLLEISQRISEAAKKQAGAQRRLNQIIADAGVKIGPRFARSLERMKASTSGFRNAMRQLKSPVEDGKNRFQSLSKAAERSAQRIKRSVQGIPGPVRTAYSRLEGYANSAAQAFGSNQRVSLSFRRGGMAKFSGPGLVPAMVSPGELISYKGREVYVPGRPEPRDSVRMNLPPGAKIFTFDGQARLAMGASQNEALRKQAPHFARGGVVGDAPRPRLVGGARVPRATGQSAIDRGREQAMDWVKKLKPTLDMITRIASGFGLQMTSGFRLGDDGYHGVNRARDYSNSSGPTPEMFKFGTYVANNFQKHLLELIYTPLGFGIKNGARTAPYAAADHYDHVHVAMRNGGIIPRFKKGGWVKTGYTVFDDAGGGYLGHLQQGRGYAELGTATRGGQATGRGYIAQALGMSGELRDKFPLDVMINGNKLKMFKRDRGYGQGTPAYSIDIYKDSWDEFGIGATSKGSAMIRKSATAKQIAKTKEAARKLIQRIKGARRKGGVAGFLDAARKNAGKALGLAGDGEIDLARDRIAKGHRQVRKAMKNRKPGTPGTPGAGGSGATDLDSMRRAIAFLEEEIELMEQNFGADWSAGGSALDPENWDGNVGIPGGSERGQLIAKNEALYKKLEELRNAVQEKIKNLVKKVAGLQANIQKAQSNIADFEKKIKKSKDKKKIEGWKKDIKKQRGKIGKWREQLSNAQSTLGDFRSELDDLQGITGQGGKMGAVKFVLDTLRFQTPAEPGEGPDTGDSEIADLLRQQLAESQRALAITQAQMPIFQQFMPRFHQGGIVQGPMGAERPVMAQAGEGIFTREQMRAMGSQNITVVIEDAAIDSNRIRVEVDGVIQEKVSTVRRQGSNRRFATK